MDNFEKITQSREALGEFLSSLPVVHGPWDTAFQSEFCARCTGENCDGCAPAERNSPFWWLGLPAEAVP